MYHLPGSPRSSHLGVIPVILQSTCYHLCNPWGVTQNFCYPGFRKCYRVCNRWGVTQNFCYPGFRKCYRVCNRWSVTQNFCYPGFRKCYRVCNRWEFLLPSSNRAQKTYQGLVVWPPLPLPAPSPEARSALPPAAVSRSVSSTPQDCNTIPEYALSVLWAFSGPPLSCAAVGPSPSLSGCLFGASASSSSTSLRAEHPSQLSSTSSRFTVTKSAKHVTRDIKWVLPGVTREQKPDTQCYHPCNR